MRDHKHDRQYVDVDGKTVTVYAQLSESEAKAIRRHKGRHAEVKVARTRTGTWEATVRE